MGRCRWIDYSFMSIGGLHQDSVDVMQALCRRFGAGRAMSVYATTVDWSRGNTQGNLAIEIINECGIQPSDDDLKFLMNLAMAETLIQRARKLLEEATHGQN